MSDRLKSTGQYSNEEIIDDLTKNLKSSLSVEENSEEFVISPGSSAEELPTEAGDASGTSKVSGTQRRKSYEDRDFDDDESDGHKSDSDTDSIDEVALKDAEISLTEDQKAERQIIAEQLKVVGNEAFKVGDYERSIEKYTEGLKICPLQYSQQRAILYCNRSAAKMKLEKYPRAIKDCTRAIELDDKYLKAYIRRAQSYEATDKLDESLADFKKILELDPTHKEAQKAIVRLPPLIEEKNEKLKTEMLGKLKDLAQEEMARCKRRKRKLCKFRCRNKCGRFKRCRAGDRRYPVGNLCRRRSCSRRRRRRRSRCRRASKYLWRCRSCTGQFKRCRHCDRRYRLRKRPRGRAASAESSPSD